MSMRALRLRAPELNELPSLHALCLRSKAVWGYDADFMSRCADTLRVSRYELAKGRVAIAEWPDEGAPMGVAQWSLDGRVAELDLLFVEPACQRSGVGRVLLQWVIAQARARGAHVLGILADPGARPFYEAMGARYVRDEDSDAVAGRTLPWLELRFVRRQAAVPVAD